MNGGMVDMHPDYIHSLAGRIRIKVPEIKGSSIRAEELEKKVQWQPGIESIKANHITGSVLIYYNPQETGQDHILRALQESGYLRQITPGWQEATGTQDGFSSLPYRVVASVAQTMMEAALTRLVTAII
ncbi:HMA2 domain-containing protein [Desulfobacca acetoxidans]